MATKRKSKPPSKSRANSATRGQSGRVTPSASARAGSDKSDRSDKSERSTRSGKASKASTRPSEPDLNVAAVDRLVARVNDALPRGRVRSAFSGTSGLSPNAVTVVGALPGVVVVGVSVATHQPWLLVVAFAVMAATILGCMKFANTTCIVAELPDEMVVFSSSRSLLEPRHRGPLDVVVRPYFDGRWLKVEVPGDTLFVSKRAFGAVVRRLAGTDETLDDPIDAEVADGSDDGDAGGGS